MTLSTDNVVLEAVGVIKNVLSDTMNWSNDLYDSLRSFDKITKSIMINMKELTESVEVIDMTEGMAIERMERVSLVHTHNYMS
jgi:hypothetical protein